MKAMHALSAVALAGAALLGGDAVALAQATMATAVATAAAPQPRAGTFMKIEGFTGSSTDRSHAGWIEISSFQWGVGRGITGTTGSAGDRQGRASVSDIQVTKHTDTSSPKLVQASASGTHFPEVVIEFVRPDKQIAYQVKMKDVVVSKYAMSSGGDRPTESVTLNFSKIEWTYTSQKPDGTSTAPQTAPATWDIVQATKA